MNDRFESRFDELAESPELGRSADELKPGVKRVNEGVYAIFFRETEGGTEILRVIHGMRDLDRQFRG